jgi:hypothetical protein
MQALAAANNLRIQVAPSPVPAPDAVVDLNLQGSARKERHAFTFQPQIEIQEKMLAEIADLDSLLGFKGNYMIFPLLNSNVLTDFMMAPYVDSKFAKYPHLGRWIWTALSRRFQLYLKSILQPLFRKSQCPPSRSHKRGTGL